MIKNKYYKLGLNKRIALFADIHYSKNYNELLFEEIILNLKKNKPDYICISGDVVDSADIIFDELLISTLKNFIKNISLIAPIILVKGNHDETFFDNKKEVYLDSNEFFLSLNELKNVYYLDNNSVVFDNISFNGINLDFDFYYNKNHEDFNFFIKEIDSKLKEIDTQKYNILLCHTPSNILNKEVLKKSKNINKFDLVLSGHMHNGLVFDLFDKIGNRGIVGPYYKFFPKFSRGHISLKKINLIITGGIIKFAYSSPKIFQKFNFLFKSSIDYIDI